MTVNQEKVLGLTLAGLGFALLLLALLSCAPQGTTLALGAPGSSDDQDARAVMIHTVCPEGGYASSGVIVSDRRILAASHGVPCDGPIVAVLHTGETFALRRERVWNDITALYTGESTGFNAMTYGKAPKRWDTVCYVVAFPRRKTTCTHIIKTTPHMVTQAGQAVKGNSGSGVYNERGHLIGLVSTITGMTLSAPARKELEL